MSTRHPLEAGLTLRSYRLVALLGRGGQGEVWEAASSFGRVAIKARPLEDDAQEEVFRREFQKLRALRIPGVVRVFDTDTDQGYIFYTMELARGLPFQAYVQQTGAPEAGAPEAGAPEAGDLGVRVRRAVAAAAQVARALVGIHRLGLAHRDIKPENILVDDDGTATVLDFGTVAFGQVQDKGRLTGTFAYLSPEQRIGQAHDHRVDLFALGTLLHEAITGTPPGRWRLGKRRPSLALLGRAVPLAIAWLVDALLSLDPEDRPTAEVCEDILTRCARGESPPCPWPEPPRWQGDAAPLQGSSGVVVGPPGSGKHRMVMEARARWFAQGYASVAGRCSRDRPFGAVAEILRALLAIIAPSEHRTMLADAGALAHVLPALPVEPPPAADPVEMAAALARLLGRLPPVALVFWNLDFADAGTRRLLDAFEPPPRVRIWGTAQRPVSGLPALPPPAWSAAAERAVLPSLTPDGQVPPGAPGVTPLESCVRAWALLARRRGEPGPLLRPPANLVALCVLDEPFPRAVAAALTADVDALTRAGHLTPTDTGHLRFTDRGTWLSARAHLADPDAAHALAAQAWQRARGVPTRALHIALHAVRSGHPRPSAIARALRTELARDNTAELTRWLRLWDLTVSAPDTHLIAFCRLRVLLATRPATVARERLDALLKSAKDPEERGRAAWLLLKWEIRFGTLAEATQRGRRWAETLEAEHPELASPILREVALAHIHGGESEPAAAAARRALTLATTARPDRLGPAEVIAATTLSAAYILSGRLTDAADTCRRMADRCAAAGLHRGEGAFWANLAHSQICQGERAAAAESAARCRAVQSAHRDPLVGANCALIQARLAVEAGDMAAARPLLDEAITIGQALASGRLLAEAWALVLEAAVQSADVSEAQRALRTYGRDGVRSSHDLWPAALARWLWLTGDLDSALEATRSARLGHARTSAQAERSRLLLVRGDSARAKVLAERVAAAAAEAGMAEVALFAEAVGGAAGAISDERFAPLMRRSRSSQWVHLYLGVLHLDAIRRQRRGENIQPRLRELRGRSEDVRHSLYRALAHEQGW